MALRIMMTAEEYRTKAFEAQERADRIHDPQWKEAFTTHAMEWTALAMRADIQAQLEIAAAREDG